MPYLSDAELRGELARSETSLAAPSAGDSMNWAPVLGGMGAAAAVGFLRSKLEDSSTGQWNIPGTKWDAEAVAFLALLGLAVGGQYVGLGEYRSYAALGAIGVGSHFAGELGRRYGKTGQLSWNIGAGLPPWDPTSFDPTQLTNPYDDAQAQGLGSSGV